MLIITPVEEIDAYYTSDNQSQSDLKKLLQGIEAYKAEDKDLSDKPYIIIGKAVDTILTSGQEDFDKHYYISDGDKKPSEKVAQVVEIVYNLVKEDYENYLIDTAPVEGATELTEQGEVLVLDNDSIEDPAPQQISLLEFAGNYADHKAYILQGCEDVNYYPKWGDDAKLTAMTVSDAVLYFQDLCNSFGKCIISTPTKNTIYNIVENLRTNLRTRRYFDREVQVEFTNLTFILQMPIYFEYRGIKCKALLDMVIVCRDEAGKILWIQPLDLKTMNGNTYNFIDSVRSYRYDIQAAWYTLAISQHYATSIEGGLIKPFKFIAESTSWQGKPLVYECDPSLLEMGRNGRQEIVIHSGSIINEDVLKPNISTPVLIARQILGYEQLIDTLLYHQENGWDAEKEIQEADANEEALLITWNGIIPRTREQDFFNQSSVE